MKSVRGLGVLSIVGLLGSGVSALMGLIDLAIFLASVCGILVLGIIQIIERRRHVAHRQIVHNVALIRKGIEANSDSLLRLQKQQLDSSGLAFKEIKSLQQQHAKSLGLTFREIRSLRQQHSDSLDSTFREIKSLQQQHSDSLDSTFREIKSLQQQHTKSLGLTFREIKSLSVDLTGEEPLLEVYAERQLATYLNALRITKRELLEANATYKSANTVAPADSGKN